MMTKMKLFKIPAYLLGVLTFSLVLTANSLAADFYKVVITQVVPRSTSGDVFVQFTPGTGEERFTGKAKAMLIGTDSGTNKNMAVLLTAITLKSEVTLSLENVPTFQSSQVINSVGLVAP